jgi:small subunit ribosomal protein S6
MNQYETAFVVAPSLSEEETSALIHQLAEVVLGRNGQMVKQDLWGKRKLAYPINGFKEAFYVFFTYQGAPAVPAELERKFKQTDAILRFMTIKKDPRDLVKSKKRIKPEVSEETRQDEVENQPRNSSRQEVK